MIWECKIGIKGDGVLLTMTGADLPMRDAIAKAYKEVTGVEPDFIFSGWNAKLTESQRWVVEND